jgi:hypothetical protein
LQKTGNHHNPRKQHEDYTMNASQHPNYQWIRTGAANDDMMTRFQAWIDAGTHMVWLPIYDREYFPDNAPEMMEIARTGREFGCMINCVDDLLTLPAGIKGWIMPVTTNDTDIVCGRWENAIYFMGAQDSRTGGAVTYQIDRAELVSGGTKFKSTSRIHATQVPKRQV